MSSSLLALVSTFLIFGAAGLALLALLYSSEATLGAILVGLACLSGIFARIAQASSHHVALKELLKRS